MKSLILKILLLMVFLQGCKDANVHEVNSIEKNEKVLLKEEGQEEFFYWELKDEERLWGFEIGEVGALNQYRDTLKLELGHQKYESAINNESIQNLDKTFIEEENGDRKNALLIHTGSVGKIRKINYLESQILNYQLNRFPLFSHPTEFHGFIIKNEKEHKIRVYFGSSDTEWPPKPTVIIEELEKVIHGDWELIGHLHNHYSRKDNNYIGILAPSLADAQYYKFLKDRYNIKRALITNGFHTVEIKSDHFKEFESH